MLRHTLLILLPLLTLAPRAMAADDAADLQAVADKVMESVLRDRGLPGGVLAIVKDGRVVVLKGYGLADRDRRVPMDARTTRLPAASISKVVTATAVMQLVQQGRIDLDRPVNDYLKGFAIASPYDEPVRVRHLLTHTAGFDEYFVGLMVAPGQRPQLGRALATHEPALITRPGTSMLYSNHSIALAGHIVETVAGEPFAAHVARALFEPLGMRSSSFELTPDRAPNLATGYTGEPAVTPWHPPVIHLIPAAGLTTTAADMAQFLLAHLEGGPAEGPQILTPQTRQTMHARQFTPDPRVAGVAYGLFEQFHSGVRALMHDGDWTGYSHRMVLLPEQRLGIFVSFNAWRVEARAEVMHRIVQAVLQRDRAAPPAPAAGNVSARDFAGTYWWNRYPHRGLLKWMGSKMEVTVSAVDDRTLDVNGMRFAAVAPDFFRRVDGDGAIVRAPDGRVVLEIPVQMGPLVMERIPWYGTGRVQQGLRLPLIAVCATCLVWPIAAIVRRVRRRPRPESRRAAAIARLLATIAALSVVVSPLWFAQVTRLLMFGTPAQARLLLLVPPITAVLAAALCVCAVLAWRRKFWTLGGRLHYSVLAASVVIYALVLGYWNLLRVPNWLI